MSIFLSGMVWGTAVLFCLMGWGLLLQNLLCIEKSAGVVLDAATLGMAVACSIGGILNLCAISSQQVLIVFVLVGIAIFFITIVPYVRKPRLTGAFLGCVCLAVLMVVRLAGSVIVPPAGGGPGSTFNPHDDLHSYLVSIERLEQTGTLGIDPFNSRLMMSSLGGQHFLGALVLSVLPQDNVHVLDNGIGVVALALSAGGLGLRLKLSRAATMTLMIAPLLLPMQLTNISSSFTSAAGLLALVSFLMDENAGRNVRGMVPAGLLLAMVCGLKSTMIPAAMIFAILWGVGKVLMGPRLPAIRSTLVLLILAVVFLTPWMLWQHESSGTFLYPVLGNGDHISGASVPWPRAPMPAAVESEILRNSFSISVIVVGIFMMTAMKRIKAVLTYRVLLCVLALVVAWLCAWPVVGYATEFPDLSRYLFPTYAACMVVLIACTQLVLERWKRFASYVPLVLFTGINCLPIWKLWAEEMPRNIAAAISGGLRPLEPDIARFHDMQQAVPAGDAVLVYITNSSLLDFHRNRVLVADWPGETSLPPGMPVFRGGSAVADYLRSQGIRYVAYSYAEQANFPRKVYGDDAKEAAGKTIRRQAAESFAFQDDLMEMAHTHAVIYNNGLDFVLDLEADVAKQRAISAGR